MVSALHPICESFAKMSGMYISVAIGGNEPRDEGRTNVMSCVSSNFFCIQWCSYLLPSMHYGEGTGPIPITFDADERLFRSWITAF